MTWGFLFPISFSFAIFFKMLKMQLRLSTNLGQGLDSSDVLGLGILVAPRSSTFWVSLGGYFSLHFFIPREEVLINHTLNSCGLVILRRVLTTILFFK